MSMLLEIGQNALRNGQRKNRPQYIGSMLFLNGIQICHCDRLRLHVWSVLKLSVAIMYQHFSITSIQFWKGLIFKLRNADETSTTTVQRSAKIVAQKGEKQVGTTTSPERGIIMTNLLAVNAIGNSVPPLLIFSRVQFRDYWLRGAPPGCIGDAIPSGWISPSAFCDYCTL